jgi:hypothetical protein
MIINSSPDLLKDRCGCEKTELEMTKKILNNTDFSLSFGEGRGEVNNSQL